MPQPAPQLHALIGLGLSEAEAQIYLAVLAAGPSTVSEISRGSGIKRTTAYTVLESLAARGFVSELARGKYKRFRAAHPETLQSLISERFAHFQKLLPDLAALYNLKGAGGTTTVYEGIEPSKQAYEALLRSARPGDPYLILTDVDKWYRLWPEFCDDFVRRRAKLGLKPRHIFTDTPFARAWIEKVRLLGATGKVLPLGMDLSISLIIVPKLVVIHQLVEPIYSVVMESPLIADMHRQMYEIVWFAIDDLRRKS